MNDKEVYVLQEHFDKSVITISVVNQSGYQQRWTWVGGAQNWVMLANLPAQIVVINTSYVVHMVRVILTLHFVDA